MLSSYNTLHYAYHANTINSFAKQRCYTVSACLHFPTDCFCLFHVIEFGLPCWNLEWLLNENRPRIWIFTGGIDRHGTMSVYSAACIRQLNVPEFREHFQLLLLLFIANYKINVILNENVTGALDIVHKTRNRLQMNEAWRTVKHNCQKLYINGSIFHLVEKIRLPTSESKIDRNILHDIFSILF